MRDFLQSTRRVSVTVGLVALATLGCLALGCQDPPEIRLVPVFPADEPDLLARAGVVQLSVTPKQIDPESGLEIPNGGPSPTVVEQGQGFTLRLKPGRWSVEVVGEDAGGGKVVFGKTPTFRIARGKSGTVKLFIGRSMAFNLVDLEPPEVAASLVGLREHSATAFTDEGGHPWILVAGGRRPENPDDPVAVALLIDPVDFTVEQLPSLTCARSGHTGFVVQTAEGPRVVLSGGDEQSSPCRSSLDIYDPISRAFQNVKPFGSESRVAAAVPELGQETSQLVHTGRVVLPGKPRYAVDLLAPDPAEEIDSPPDAPDDPRLAALSEAGRILVLTDDTLYVDEANVDTVPQQCFDSSGWDEFAVFGPVEERNGGELHPLASNKFLYVGGLAADGGEPELGWSIISTVSCNLQDYTEGRRAPGDLLAHGFPVIDLQFATTSIDVLLPGGWSQGEPVSQVVMMTQPSGITVPTFHDVSSGDYDHLIALRRPRAGHAAVQLPHDGTWWVIGGADDDARPEIFVRGSVSLEPVMDDFDRRRPPLTAMTVVDNSAGTYALNSDLATSFPADFYSEQAEFSTLAFVSATADRGIKDGAFAPAVNKVGCDEASEPSYKLVVSGVVPNEDELEATLGDDVLVIPYDGQTSPTTGPLDQSVDNLSEHLPNDESGCAWRQLLKVGLDGVELTRPGGDFDPGVPLRLGVHVLVMVTSADDCSQNIYGQGVPPVEVSSFHCTSDDDGAENAFDDYFGVPPIGDHADELASLVGSFTWDPSDLIVAVVGNMSHVNPAACETGGYGELRRPRRLIETVEFLENEIESQVELVDVCGGGDKPALVEALEAVGDLIRGQNPEQACVPPWVTEVQPDFEYDDGEPRLVAVRPDDEKPLAVKEDVKRRCWVVHREVHEPPELGETEDVWRGVTVPDSVWRIGTNFDGRAGGTDCEWIVRFDPFKDSTGKDVSNAELVCLP